MANAIALVRELHQLVILQGTLKTIDARAGWSDGTFTRWASGRSKASLPGFIDYLQVTGHDIEIVPRQDTPIYIPRFLKRRNTR